MNDNDREFPVICTPSLLWWVFALGSAIYGCLPILMPDKGVGHKDDWILWLICGGFWLTSLCCIVYQLVTRIVADENGISWRTIRGANRADWSEVGDYYDEEVAGGNGRTVKSTVIARESKVRFDKNWRNASNLKTAIAFRAASAKAHEWGFLGARDEEEWPQVFGYSQRNGKAALAAAIVLDAGLIVLAYTMVHAMYVKSIETYHHIEPTTIASSVFMLLLVALYAIFVNGACLPRYRQLSKRKNQTITVDRETLTFSDGATVLTVHWNEVTDYYWTCAQKQFLKANNLGRIETLHGPVSFYHEINYRSRLAKIVEKYAVNAKQREWRIVQSYDSLETPSSVADQALGVRRFGYRNRTVRALVGLPTICTVAPMIAVACQYVLGTPVLIVTLGLSCAVLPITVYGWAVFFRSAIVIDDDAITKISPLGELRIRWDDVQEVKIKPLGERSGGYVKSDRAKISITGYETNVGDLVAEIERRAVNATIKRSE